MTEHQFTEILTILKEIRDRLKEVNDFCEDIKGQNISVSVETS